MQGVLRNTVTALGLVGVMAVTSPLQAAEVTVESPTGLINAVKNAAGGDVILLAPGNYGQVRLKSPQFDTPVTLGAADRANPPVFSGFTLENARNLVIDGFVFTRGETIDTASFFNLVNVKPSEHITFVHCRFAGSTILTGDDAGYGEGYGTMVRQGCADITYRRCVFTNLKKCIVSGANARMTFEQNYFYRHREDAFSISGSDLLIADNLIVDGRPRILPDGQGDHSDAIAQNGIRASVIRDNFIRVPGQGITGYGYGYGTGDVLDPDLPPGECSYLNNIIYTPARNAIHMRDMPNSSYAHNVILAPGDGLTDASAVTECTGEATNTVIEHNIGEGFNPNGVGLTVRDNILAQRTDPRGENYYGDLFVDALSDAQSTLRGFGLLPGVFDDLPVRPGLDLGEYFWLNVGNVSDATNEMYPLWQQLDAVGRAKLAALLELTVRPPGDADEDGDVDLDDFVLLKQHFGTTGGALWADGDFDGDGDVDLDDFVLLKQHFGQAQAVPDR